MREALSDAQIAPTAAVPSQRGVDMPGVTSLSTWNHPCPSRGCVVWVPNHLTHCRTHNLESP